MNVTKFKKSTVTFDQITISNGYMVAWPALHSQCPIWQQLTRLSSVFSLFSYTVNLK